MKTNKPFIGIYHIEEILKMDKSFLNIKNNLIKTEIKTLIEILQGFCYEQHVQS